MDPGDDSWGFEVPESDVEPEFPVSEFPVPEFPAELASGAGVAVSGSFAPKMDATVRPDERSAALRLASVRARAMLRIAVSTWIDEARSRRAGGCWMRDEGLGFEVKDLMIGFGVGGWGFRVLFLGLKV